MNIQLVPLTKSALYDFGRNKVRTFLTSLGITIGVLAVLMLISLGIGLRNYLSEQFESLGSNLIIVLPGGGFGGEGGFSGLGPGLLGGVKFDEKDVVNLARIPEAKYVIPSSFQTTLIEANGKEEFGYIQGTNEQVFRGLNLEPQIGSVFDKSDVIRRAKVAYLGHETARKLFGENSLDDAINRYVRIDNTRFRIIGIAKKKGDNEADNSVYVPYKTIFGTINPDKKFFNLAIVADSSENIGLVKNKIEEILLDRYDDEDFSVAEQAEILSSISQIFLIVNVILVAIGSISLIVGGIGIMNIMYATVTERIKEVGIRRAVGATQSDILLQFLTEAVLLSLLGGSIGLILASIITLIVHNFFPVEINFFAVIITLGISSAIGIFFGVFPARRASKLPPIEAIRYE